MKRFSLFFLLTVYAICSSGQSQPFYICTENQQLLKLNINSCDTTFIGLTALAVYDIAITPDNRLYGIYSSTVFEIDTSTAALTTIAIFPNISSNSLVSDSAGNLLTVDDDSVYQIDRFTGQLSCLGYYGPYASSGDLTFYNNALYLSALSSQLVKINLGPVITSQLIGTMLATNIYGINTVCLNNNEIMIASGGDSYFSSLYIVNPANASLTLLCDSIVHTLIYGATSKKDFTSNESCFTTGLNIPVFSGELKLSPNPASNELRIANGEISIERIEIYNILGEKIYFPQLETRNQKLVTVNVSTLTSGIYFVKVKTDTGISVVKFVKE